MMRRERDSNPRYTFGVYTLSRRASSTTRAPLLVLFKYRKCAFCYYKLPYFTFSTTKVQNLSIKQPFQMQIILKKISISENAIHVLYITVRY